MKRFRRSVPAMNRSCRFVWAMKRSRRSVPAMKRSRARRTMTMKTELIPGLPDYLALECLLRLPFHAIFDARAVCKRWQYELDSQSFYRIRRADGLAHRVVSLLLRGKLPHTVGKFYVALYEPDTGVCTMRQLAPDRPTMRQRPPDCLILRMGSSDVGIVGRELVVICGWDAIKNRRTGEIHFYDLLSGAWRPGAPKPAPQRDLSWTVLRGDKVFVIGGSNRGGKKLRSALVYDVPADTWIKIADLERLESLPDDGFDSNFWKSREEYISGIQCCREKLLLGEDDDLIFYPTKGGKEIVFPEENLILNENAVANLRQHLGILPYELGRYLECFHSGRL